MENTTQSFLKIPKTRFWDTLYIFYIMNLNVEDNEYDEDNKHTLMLSFLLQVGKKIPVMTKFVEDVTARYALM